MNARRLRLTVLVPLCALAGILAFGVSSAGALVSQFGSQGQGAGQFEGGGGIAVNQASGDVYLLDGGNDRVDVFTAEGAFVMAWGEGVADGVTRAPQSCTTTCFPGIAFSREETSESGAGELGAGPAAVAVDNDPLSVSYQDVYVSEAGNRRVEKFSPSGSFISMFGKEVNENGTDVCLAGEKCQAGRDGTGDGEFSGYIDEGALTVGPTGDVFVGDHERVQEFSPEGAFIASFALNSGGYALSLAVDGAGNMYVASYQSPSLNEYDSSGAFVRTFDAEGEPKAVTLDGSDDLFVADNPGGQDPVHHMLEYGPGGEQLASYDTGAESFSGNNGIAFSESLDVLYVIEPEDVRLLAPPVPGPELVGNASASPMGPTSATLNATVNPEGNATSYRFEYGPTSAYGSSLPSPEGSLPASFKEELVSATLTKLTADATYHYRIVATDSKGRVATGPDETFTTQTAVLIDDLSTTNVAATSLTFEALLNPLGVAGSYRLEYDTSEYVPGGPSHGEVAAEGALGAGTSDVPIKVHVDGLRSGTLYHYRVVAHDTREGVEYTVDSPDQTFTTQGLNGGLTLPDGRQWEMVSPPEKNGAQILAIGNDEGGSIEAAADGRAMTYLTAVPTEANPQGYANEGQVFSTRGASGWVSRDIQPAHEAASGPSIGFGEEYRFFSEDLSLGLVQPFGSFTRSLSDEASEQTPFMHTEFLNGNTGDPCLEACYRPLVTGAPGHANVPPETEFGNDTRCDGGTIVVCGPIFVGADPDLHHVLLTSEAALTSTPVPGEDGRKWSLYEWSDGDLNLVSILPSGQAANQPSLGVPPFGYGGGSGGSFGGFDSARAISNDGSRIVWSAENHLYLTVISSGKAKTVQLDIVQGGSGRGEPKPLFQTASVEGSRVFFTDAQRLTADSEGTLGEPALYECEMRESSTGLECGLSNLTPSKKGESLHVQNVIGASEDGSWLYYVVGTTLYGRHSGLTRTVAVLSGGDTADGQDWNRESLREMTSRVSPDGRWVAFMSQRQLTSYDTRDAITGEQDVEVYLYDAEANDGAGKVVCASCDPTSARPVGLTVGLITSGAIADVGFWSSPVAANIPGWTPFWLFSSLYQSRYLSDSGRLFFNSFDSLVPQDVNGTEDVYEFEPPGVGDCTTASVSFSTRSGGCVGLISSGGSAEESGFMDATANGSEVFFLTTSKLAGADRDSALDLYDARECGVGAPCLSQPPTVPPPCDTGDSCKTAPSLQPAVFGAPASATFTGAGNVSGSNDRATVKKRTLTRAQKLARALRACRKEKRRQQASCRRRAKAKYAVRTSSRANAIRKGGR
jgi:WD40 repeat protein